VQPEVDDREVRRLATVDVEQRDGVKIAGVQPPVDLEELGGVGDEAGVVVGPEVLALRLEGRPDRRIVAPVLRRVEERDVRRDVGEPGIARVREQEANDFRPAACTAVVVLRRRPNSSSEKWTSRPGAVRGVGTSAVVGAAMTISG
jgi:hypothetical protein